MANSSDILFWFLFLCPANGVEWQGLTASEVKQQAFAHTLPGRVPSTIYHPDDSWQVPFLWLLAGSRQTCFCNVTLVSGHHDAPAHRVFHLPLHAIVQPHRAAQLSY
jgi:hypothetical protein